MKRAAAALLCALACAAANALPTFAEVKASHRPSDFTLVDRNGTPIQTVRVDKSVRRLAWTPGRLPGHIRFCRRGAGLGRQ